LELFTHFTQLQRFVLKNSCPISKWIWIQSQFQNSSIMPNLNYALFQFSTSVTSNLSVEIKSIRRRFEFISSDIHPIKHPRRIFQCTLHNDDLNALQYQFIDPHTFKWPAQPQPQPTTYDGYYVMPDRHKQTTLPTQRLTELFF